MELGRREGVRVGRLHDEAAVARVDHLDGHRLPQPRARAQPAVGARPLSRLGAPPRVGLLRAVSIHLLREHAPRVAELDRQHLLPPRGERLAQALALARQRAERQRAAERQRVHAAARRRLRDEAAPAEVGRRYRHRHVERALALGRRRLRHVDRAARDVQRVAGLQRALELGCAKLVGAQLGPRLLARLLVGKRQQLRVAVVARPHAPALGAVHLQHEDVAVVRVRRRRLRRVRREVQVGEGVAEPLAQPRAQVVERRPRLVDVVDHDRRAIGERRVRRRVAVRLLEGLEEQHDGLRGGRVVRLGAHHHLVHVVERERGAERGGRAADVARVPLPVGGEEFGRVDAEELGERVVGRRHCNERHCAAATLGAARCPQRLRSLHSCGGPRCEIWL